MNPHLQGVKRPSAWPRDGSGGGRRGVCSRPGSSPPGPNHLDRPSRAAKRGKAQQTLDRDPVLAAEGPAAGGHDSGPSPGPDPGPPPPPAVPEGGLGGDAGQVPSLHDGPSGLGLQIGVFLLRRFENRTRPRRRTSKAPAPRPGVPSRARFPGGCPRESGGALARASSGSKTPRRGSRSRVIRSRARPGPPGFRPPPGPRGPRRASPCRLRARAGPCGSRPAGSCPSRRGG